MSITIYDIAQKAGVSIATVSRVFNESNNVSAKTKEKILKIADELGYHPQAHAQGLASKKTNTIMVVVPVISNYFFMEVLGGIQKKLFDQHYDLTIFNVSPGNGLFDQIEHIIKRKLAEGYLFISTHLTAEQWKQLQKYEVPLNLIDEHYEGFDSVSVDNIKGAYSAVSYFLNKGYSRIAFLSALETSQPIRDRRAGYQKALEEHNIKLDEDLIFSGDLENRDGFTERGGYEAMMKIISSNKNPEAVFCASDIQAFGAMKAMKDAGQKLPIIGYDDIQLSEYIGLSTVRQPMHEMGLFATQLLLDRIKNPEKSASQTVYTPELILRASTEEKTINI